jgi:hypothetical protein
MPPELATAAVRSAATLESKQCAGEVALRRAVCLCEQNQCRWRPALVDRSVIGAGASQLEHP